MCGIVDSFVDRIVGCLVDQILGQVKYLFCFSNNIQKLRKEIEDLKNKRDALQLKVDAAKVDEVIGPDVRSWLMKVEETNKQAEDVLEAMVNLKWANIKSRYALSKKATEIASGILGLSEGGNFQTVVYPAPLGQIPYATTQDFGGFESRMSIRRQVLKALGDNKISVIGVCGMAGVGKTVMAKEIADRVKMDNIFEKVAMAVVSQNHEPEKEESKNQLIIKIQEQLADELKFTISEKNSVHARAERLSVGLQNVGDKGVLIILDDLWQDLDLKAIGISTVDQSKKLKVLLTSRLQNVCISTGAQKIFDVEVLKDEEAWRLFKETAVVSDDTANVVHIAEQVAKQCGGLPLAIVIVANALRNKNEGAWSDALEQLTKSAVTHMTGMHDFVYSRIEWSYDHLDSGDAKLVLLLCSLFPEDFDIPTEDLVRYAKGIQLFKDLDEIKRVRDRVESVVHGLKDCYLLLAGSNEKHVKLHDVVRDVCLLIASKEQKGYMVSNYGVIEGLQDDIVKSYTAVSLTVNGMNQVPSNLDCSRIELLRLFCGRLLDIPMYIFEGPKKLKVLHLQYVNIQSPLQYQSLIGVRSLCLEYCKLNTDLSFIGGLQNLQILSFFRSQLLDFPKAIETLSRLKSLNLRFRECLDPLPSGVLRGLKSLEELYLGDYMLATNDKEQDQKILPFSQQHVAEMNLLSNLNMLQILTNNNPIRVQVLQGLRVEHMSRFYIGRTRKQDIRDYQFRKTLELFEIEGKILADPSISVILKTTENLTLEVKGVKNFVNELDKDGFVNLRELKLLSGDYVYLIDAANLVSGNIFQNLEYLKLDGLSNLFEISNGILPVGSFRRLQKVRLKNLSKMMYLWRHSIQPPSLCKLRDLHVSNCDAITSLFPQSTLKCLVQLQDLYIYECQDLEEIVSTDETTSSMEVLELPKLKMIRIECTRLRSLCIDSGTITSVANERPLLAMLNRVSLPSMESLSISETDGLEYIIGGDMQSGSLDNLRLMELNSCRNLWSIFVPEAFHFCYPAQLLPNLEELTLASCPAVEVLFDFERLVMMNKKDDRWEEEEQPKPKVIHVFHRLERVDLYALDGLKHVWRMQQGLEYNLPRGRNIIVEAFQNLKSLTVRSCDSLRYLLSPFLAQMLVGLVDLRIYSCTSMEEVISIRGGGRLKKEEKEKPGEEEEDEEEDSNGTVEIKRTQTKDMGDRESKIISTIVFPKLRTLTLLRLPNLRLIFSGSSKKMDDDELLVFPSLDDLEIDQCPLLTKFCDGPKLSAPKLKKVKLWDSILPEDLMVSLQSGSLDNLRQMGQFHCRNLRSIFVPEAFHFCYPAQLFPSLEELSLGQCPTFEVLFDFERLVMMNKKDEGMEEEEQPKPKVIHVFHRLERVRLQWMDGLKHVWRMQQGLEYNLRRGQNIIVEAFQNLKSLQVRACKSLRYLLSPSVAKMLVGLVELTIFGCISMEEVISIRGGGRLKKEDKEKPGEEEEDSNGTVEIKRTQTKDMGDSIVFPKLRTLWLDDLPNLRLIFSGSSKKMDDDELLVFPSLDDLYIQHCPLLTKVCDGPKLSAPKLKKVKLRNSILPEDLMDREIVRII